MLRSINAKIKSKLSSSTGASLMVALLFFIMCAVVGSVILAAAMSAVGRLKGLPEQDNRRYAVQGTAKVISAQMEEAHYRNIGLFQDGTDGKPKTVGRVAYYARKVNSSTGQTVEMTPIAVEGKGVSLSGTTPSPDISYISDIAPLMAHVLYDETAWSKIEGTWPTSTETLNEDTKTGTTSDSTSEIKWKNPSAKAKTEKITLTISQNASDGGTGNTITTVTADMNMNSDFSMDITLSEGSGSSAAGTTLRATPFVNVQYDTIAPLELQKDNTYTVITDPSKDVKQITVDITWKVEMLKTDLYSNTQ